VTGANDDVLDEDDETFFVHLSGATKGAIEDADGQGSILDDDAQPSLSIADASFPEGFESAEFRSWSG
jgi:hypothetical protein